MPIQKQLEERLRGWLNEFYGGYTYPTTQQPRLTIDKVIVPILALVFLGLVLQGAEWWEALFALSVLAIAIAISLTLGTKSSSGEADDLNISAPKAAAEAFETLGAKDLGADAKAALIYFLNIQDWEAPPAKLREALNDALAVPELSKWQPLLDARERLGSERPI